MVIWQDVDSWAEKCIKIIHPYPECCYPREFRFGTPKQFSSGFLIRGKLLATFHNGSPLRGRQWSRIRKVLHVMPRVPVRVQVQWFLGPCVYVKYSSAVRVPPRRDELYHRHNIMLYFSIQPTIVGSIQHLSYGWVRDCHTITSYKYCGIINYLSKTSLLKAELAVAEAGLKITDPLPGISCCVPGVHTKKSLITFESRAVPLQK